jgi:tRNA 2-thiouridine synthesizing protein C
MTQTRTLTFITRQAPHGQGSARACLDMVLSAAVFDQRVRLLFMEDGVFQLLRDQQSDAIHAKDLSAAFGALELYGVETVLVDQAALAARGLNTDMLCLPQVALCSDEQIKTLIRESDVVFSL